MTRRRTFRDPTPRLARLFEADNLQTVLASLPEREDKLIRVRFGLIDSEGIRLDEIAQVLGISEDRVRRILPRVLTKMRHQARATVLEGIRDLDFREILANKLDDLPDDKKRVFCDSHGWSAVYSDVLRRSRTCNGCPCYIPPKDTGRPSVYCSNACRQAAYRQRKRSTEGKRP